MFSGFHLFYGLRLGYFAFSFCFSGYRNWLSGCFTRRRALLRLQFFAICQSLVDLCVVRANLRVCIFRGCFLCGAVLRGGDRFTGRARRIAVDRLPVVVTSERGLRVNHPHQSSGEAHNNGESFDR